ncbi:Scr1 family TA system antitoxin-like transcriptional regulator [Streptomyces collinus]|uniref:Scr1 family TA system antitoxin-like transcriptional regulator n=1 Tax=Streptomyces collinus TaxID=42684 RepID=UPI003812822D
MVPSFDVLDRLSSALGLDDSSAREVRDLLVAVEAAADAGLASGDDGIAGAVLDDAVRSARLVRSFQCVVLPGMLQSAEYARHVFQSAPNSTPEAVGRAVAARVERQSALADGPPVTKRLISTGPRGGQVWRTSLNEEAWKRALASVGVIPKRKRGEPYAESRENGMHALRHFYASVLLDAGENIKALAEYLGHSDPGLTLRVYAHLMPSSQERTRKAVAAVFEGAYAPVR